uniref:ABC transporter ATP-binding protein n=1 Tax=Candidatus Ventrenecus sp. TaxID=3085654 RepID=UPI003FF04468
MKEFIKNMKFVWKYAKSEKKKIIVYFLLSVFGICFSILFPFMSAKQIVLLTNESIKQFIYMSVIVFICILLEDTLDYFKSKLYQKIFRQIYINIQSDLGAEILKLSNQTLEENGSGIFIQRLIGDTKNISTIFTDLNRYINGIIANIGILITYFVLSKTVFIFVLFAFSIRMIIEVLRINIYNKNNANYKKSNDAMTSFTGEIVRGAEDIKMLNGEKSFLDELRTRFENLNSEKYNMENINLTYLVIRWYWAAISLFVISFIIGISVLNGSLAVATGIVLFNFGNRYNSLVQNITGFHELIKKFNLSATRIFDIFEDEKYVKETFGDKHLDKVDGNFEFKNVNFKYKENKVLNHLNFRVKANETVAFVGKSGAGKTTIFNLLCKMYDNYDGKITIDGVDIKVLDKDSIRGNITIVSQNPYIFNMSIRDNLKLVKKDLNEEEMIEACHLAALDDFIESLPLKYDTIVGEGGITLSGGQKQRLAIARAFVQKTEIILFDEATSALDNETQAKIQQAIDNLQQEYTILIIAHRLSTVKNADRILMIEDGRIVAEGKHNELIKNCKSYKELYETEIVKQK